MSIIMNKFLLFQAFVKYRLHCKHLNKILFEIDNFGFSQHFFEPIKNTNSSTKKIQMLKKYLSTEANYLQNSQAPTLSKKFYLHDIFEDSPIVGGE